MSNHAFSLSFYFTLERIKQTFVDPSKLFWSAYTTFYKTQQNHAPWFGAFLLVLRKTYELSCVNAHLVHSIKHLMSGIHHSTQNTRKSCFLSKGTIWSLFNLLDKNLRALLHEYWKNSLHQALNERLTAHKTQESHASWTRAWFEAFSLVWKKTYELFCMNVDMIHSSST